VAGAALVMRLRTRRAHERRWAKAGGQEEKGEDGTDVLGAVAVDLGAEEAWNGMDGGFARLSSADAPMVARSPPVEEGRCHLHAVNGPVLHANVPPSPRR
jgi:hypothetical protein